MWCQKVLIVICWPWWLSFVSLATGLCLVSNRFPVALTVLWRTIWRSLWSRWFNPWRCAWDFSSKITKSRFSRIWWLFPWCWLGLWCIWPWDPLTHHRFILVPGEQSWLWSFGLQSLESWVLSGWRSLPSSDSTLAKDFITLASSRSWDRSLAL